MVNLKSPLTKPLRMVSLNSMVWTMVSTMCMSKFPRSISTKSSSPTNVFMRRLTCLGNNSPVPVKHTCEYTGRVVEHKKLTSVKTDMEYQKFKKSAQREVNYLVKEFECKKSADAYAQAHCV